MPGVQRSIDASEDIKNISGGGEREWTMALLSWIGTAMLWAFVLSLLFVPPAVRYRDHSYCECVNSVRFPMTRPRQRTHPSRGAEAEVLMTDVITIPPLTPFNFIQTMPR